MNHEVGPVHTKLDLEKGGHDKWTLMENPIFQVKRIFAKVGKAMTYDNKLSFHKRVPTGVLGDKCSANDYIHVIWDF